MWKALYRIGPEFILSEKQQFCKQDQEHAYPRGGCNFPDEIPERTKTHPFKENQVYVVEQRQDKDISAIRRPSHTGNGWRTIVFVNPFLRYE